MKDYAKVNQNNINPINNCHSYTRDYDGKVTPEEVASAAMYLKDTLGKEGIQELISNLSKDRGQCIFFVTWTILRPYEVIE